MEHKNKESENNSTEKVCTNTCQGACCGEKTCAKNMSCLKNNCKCMKKLKKKLMFIMILIITISIVKMAFFTDNDRYDDYPEYGAGQMFMLR